ncbi:MAG: hypothetical protein D6714_18210 [Bacteroidetes bacterium]|nr:MAG: hypothetical protein D6714_18210 [Bacteroidota bacterium]
MTGIWKTNFSFGAKSPVKADFFDQLRLVRKVYKQQQLHYDRPDVRIPNRIVSLLKPYLRPKKNQAGGVWEKGV